MWGVIVRELAGYDPERAAQVLRWPLREGLLAYVDVLKKQAREEYKIAVLAWAPQAPYMKEDSRPPSLPKILRG